MNEQQPKDKFTVKGSEVAVRCMLTSLVALAFLAYLKPPQSPSEVFGMFVCTLGVGVGVVAWHAK